MYNFNEKTLGPNFAQDKLKEFRQLIDTALSFVVLSLPGVGVSYFLKYLAMQTFAYFIHVDLYDLPTLSQHEFYKLLLTELDGPSTDEAGKPPAKTDEELLRETKKMLGQLSQKRGKIVIILSRFDQLKDQFDWNFLSNIQSLINVAPGKIVLIFTSTRPLHEIAPESLSGGNLNFYSEELYFKPYSKDDLKQLLKIEPARPTPKPLLEKLLTLSGGHNQLLHILLSSQKEQLLFDQFVKMQLKEFVDYLDYHQRKQVQKIALGKNVTSAARHPALDAGSIIDDYLLGIGMVKKVGSSYQLFSPLLTDYIKTNLPVKLPIKESSLFKLLRKNMGNTVSKDEIFTEIWPARNALARNASHTDTSGSRSEAGGGGIDEGATDWALDALIYRLRKHPFMKANGYIIESQKKVGYTLIQV
ncbi:MAG: helix-turn-helix domain-containing protein [bacterium]|nr:helix-turn-helix domain-containing protein [bacterium]